MGGSVTDLSNLEDKPLKPSDQAENVNYIEYCDPFDTTGVDVATVPGQTELKFLEKELLSDIQVLDIYTIKTHNTLTITLCFKVKKVDLLSEEDDFNPRVEEPKPTPHFLGGKRDSINKTVAFSLPLDQSELISATPEEIRKVVKPLTPYYVRKNSVPGQEVIEDDLSDVDPFDTSFVADSAPGKAELKQIENELINSVFKNSLSDPDFNPRNEKIATVAQAVRSINTPKTKSEFEFEKPKLDLLGLQNDQDVSTKVLTPSAEVAPQTEELLYSDPFDTSIASNILPGDAELKILETELIHTAQAPVPKPKTVSFTLTSAVVDPTPATSAGSNVPDLFEDQDDSVNVKPLSPVTG